MFVLLCCYVVVSFVFRCVVCLCVSFVMVCCYVVTCSVVLFMCLCVYCCYVFSCYCCYDCVYLIASRKPPGLYGEYFFWRSEMAPREALWRPEMAPREALCAPIFLLAPRKGTLGGTLRPKSAFRQSPSRHVGSTNRAPCTVTFDFYCKTLMVCTVLCVCCYVLMLCVNDFVFLRVYDFVVVVRMLVFVGCYCLYDIVLILFVFSSYACMCVYVVMCVMCL